MGQGPGERGGLVEGQRGRGPVEVRTGGGLRAEDPRAPLDHVQVELEDAVLVQPPLQSLGHDQLQGLPEKGAVRAEVQVLGELLRDRAAPSDLVPVRPRVGDGPRQGSQVRGTPPGELPVTAPADFLGERHPVDPPVLAEAIILRHEHGAHEVRRDVSEPPPLVSELERRPRGVGFPETLLDERRALGIPGGQGPRVGDDDIPDGDAGGRGDAQPCQHDPAARRPDSDRWPPHPGPDTLPRPPDPGSQPRRRGFGPVWPPRVWPTSIPACHPFRARCPVPRRLADLPTRGTRTGPVRSGRARTGTGVPDLIRARADPRRAGARERPGAGGAVLAPTGP